MAETKEMVNNPDHYNDNPIETMEMFYLAFGDQPEKIKGALLFNIMKYRDRAGKKKKSDDEDIKKTAEEDIKKMQWYLNQLETHFPESSETYRFYHGIKELENGQR